MRQYITERFVVKSYGVSSTFMYDDVKIITSYDNSTVIQYSHMTAAQCRVRFLT